MTTSLATLGANDIDTNGTRFMDMLWVTNLRELSEFDLRI